MTSRTTGRAEPKRGGEPQQERSRTTRRRLVDAAVVCLAELGWNGTTVAVIARRAGVSRGAAQHHFPTRQARDLPVGRSRIEPVVDMLLDLYTGRMFRAALHLWVVASSDEALRAVLVPLEVRVGREAHRVAVDLLGVDESLPGVRELVQSTLDLARGLGLANLLTDDTRRRRRIARQWARVLGPALAEPGRGPRRPKEREDTGISR
jgi:AcrR family transcriptional regulator